MFKLLRKYDKWILAIGGTLLVIVFLMPQAIQGLSQWAGSRTGNLAVVGPNEDAVSQLEFESVRRQLEWLQASGRAARIGLPIQTPEHWYLLVREASQAGLVGDLPSVQLTPTDIAEQKRLGLSQRDLYSALANLAGVARVMDLYASGKALSSNRLKDRGRELFTTVDADIAVIEADPDSSILMPTEEELQAQLNDHATDVPGKGDRGFGYKLPNRVKLEWIVIPQQDIRDRLAASPDVNEVALYKHWGRNSDNPSFGPVDPDIEIPDVVRNDLLDSLTKKQMEAIARYSNAQLSAPVRRVRRKGDFFELPDDWAQQRLSLPTLAESIQNQFDITLPIYQAEGNQWTDVAEADQMKGIGQTSSDDFGQDKTKIKRLLRETKEFNGSGKYPVQTGLFGPPMRSDNGDLYLFRITDSDPSRAPISIDEVRDDLLNDIKRIDSYQQLNDRTDELAALAVNQGIIDFTVSENADVVPKKMVTLYDPIRLNFQLQLGQPLQPEASKLPKIGDHPDSVYKIVNRALELSDLGPLADQPLEDRTFVLPVDDKMALLVVQLNDILPLDTDMYGNLTHSGVLQNMMSVDELGSDEMIEVFGYDQMANRHQFELLRKESQDADDAAENASSSNTSEDSQTIESS